MILASLIAVLSLAAPSSRAERLITLCGMTFSLPTRWIAERRDPLSANCELGVSPPNWQKVRDSSERDVDAFAVSIRMRRGGLREACANEILCGDERGWYFGNPPSLGQVYPSPPAEEIRTHCCRAFVGETGGHRVYMKEGGSVEGFIGRPTVIVLQADHIVELLLEPEADDQQRAAFFALAHSLKVR